MTMCHSYWDNWQRQRGELFSLGRWTKYVYLTFQIAVAILSLIGRNHVNTAPTIFQDTTGGCIWLTSGNPIVDRLNRASPVNGALHRGTQEPPPRLGVDTTPAHGRHPRMRRVTAAPERARACRLRADRSWHGEPDDDCWRRRHLAGYVAGRPRCRTV